MSPPTSSPNFWQPLLSTIDNTPPWFSALPELLWTLYQFSKAIDCGYLRPRPVKRMVPDVVISAAIINRYPVYQWLVHGKTFSTSVLCFGWGFIWLWWRCLSWRRGRGGLVRSVGIRKSTARELLNYSSAH
ncbi:hypothetical protein HBI29_214920 [Parastagonospora nodorum]|nr:hypothetical protein HBI29_214920 [Parastagonospora nodorum]